MKGIIYIIISALLFTSGSSQAGEKKKSDPKFDGTEKSLIKNYQYPEWFRDAKFGIYTHWGPVTQALQYSEKAFGWYGRLMYTDGHPAQKYHEKYFGDPNKVGYKEIVKQFTAKEFNASEWAEIFADAGAKFAGPVAIHHDNFLMWKSELSPWNATAIGPKRDISGELAKEIRKRGMKFMGSFHHGFTYRYYEKAFMYDGKTAPMLYGPYHEPMNSEIRDTPPWRSIPRDFQKLFLDKVQEFTGKYHPDLIYFDFGMGWHDSDLKLKMYSDYYNEAKANGQPQPTIAQKAREGNQLHYSTLDLERGRMTFLTDYPWLTDDSPGAWFYHKKPILQTPNTMIDRLIDIVSKNGCLLLNIGPDHEGEIPPEYRMILKEYGKWLRVNGEGIYNTRPWYSFGEGQTQNSTGHHAAANSDSKKSHGYTSEDIRYTQSKDGKIIYAFAMDWPESNQIKMKSLMINGADLKVELLGAKGVKFSINKDKTLSLDVSEVDTAQLKVQYAYCFKLTGGDIFWHPQGHYYLPSTVIFKDEIKKTQSFEGGEITMPTEVKYGARDYEVVAELTNMNKDCELAVSVFSLENKKKGGEPFYKQILKTDSKSQLVSLGKVEIPHGGKYFIQINISKGDQKFVTISKLFMAVDRNQTILKVGDSI